MPYNIEFHCTKQPLIKFLCLGYGLGVAIGLFSSSVNPTITGPDAANQTAREIFRDFRTTSHSYGKNFAVVGLVFSAVECTIESVSNKLIP